MTKHIGGKLNWIAQALPEGLLVDASWLSSHGYSSSLRNQYVAAGWLQQPARSVYCRPRGNLSWQQAIISLQTLLLELHPAVIVGGRTALELQGYAHYLSHALREVHLYGSAPPPSWLFKLPLDVTFVYHTNQTLFADDKATRGASGLKGNIATGKGAPLTARGIHTVVQPWGQWDWPLTLSSPERALFEWLDELPQHESFHQVDALFEGLSNLSPRRLTIMLAECRSVKVKRLFLYFAARHHHAWFKRIDRAKVDIGSGKRMLFKGGRLDAATQITVPEDVYGLR